MEDVKLYEEHRCILESNKWVDDVLINASQFLLHSQYGRPGFQAATLAYNLRIDVMREFIQILHNGEDHWVTISTIGLPSGHVNVFDSLYDTSIVLSLNKYVQFYVHLTMQYISISWIL